GPVVKGTEEPRRMAAVTAVGKHRAVKSEGQLDLAEWEAMGSAVLLAMYLLESLLLKPLGNLEVADDGGPGAAGDGDGVADVVAVAVRDEDEVGGDLVGLDRRLGGVRHERIYEHALAVALQRQRGVSQPAYPCCHGRGPPSKSGL